MKKSEAKNDMAAWRSCCHGKSKVGRGMANPITLQPSTLGWTIEFIKAA